MAIVRLSVRKIREILRLSWGLGLRPGEVAASCNIARSTVQDYLLKAQAAGLSWPLAPELDGKEPLPFKDLRDHLSLKCRLYVCH